jgi:hypothetical protein
MKLTRTAPELVEAGWKSIVAAEEALNASFLRTVLVRSTEGRVVACGREESVVRVLETSAADRRPSDDAEKKLVEAAEELRHLSRAEALVLSMGDDYVLACGESREVANILAASRESDGAMAALQLSARTQEHAAM